MPASFAFGLFLIYMAIKSRLPQVKLFDYAMLAVWALLLGHSSAGDRPRQVDLELAEGSARAGHAQQSFSVNQLQSPSAISASAYLCAWNCCSSHIACSPLEESRHLCLQNTYKKQSRKTSGSKFSSKHVRRESTIVECQITCSCFRRWNAFLEGLDFRMQDKRQCLCCQTIAECDHQLDVNLVGCSSLCSRTLKAKTSLAYCQVSAKASRFVCKATLRLTGSPKISAEVIDGFLQDCFLGPEILSNHCNVPLYLSPAGYIYSHTIS